MIPDAVKVRLTPEERGCPYRKSNPEVLVMKPAENRPRQNHASSLHCTWNRRILAQRQVRAQCVVIAQVGQKNVTKVLLPEHDNMVSALPSNRSDQPFRIGIAKGSQLHPFRSMGRKLFGSPMCFTPFAGKSSRWWIGATPGERTASISTMTRAG